jgi:predicted nucleotidyltransferase
MVKSFKLTNVSGVIMDVLMLLNSQAEEMYTSEIQKNLKLSKATAIKWLRELKEFDLITEKRRGNMNYYKLNRENPIIKQVKILQNVTELMPILNKLSGQAEIYLFGSSARGEDRPDSDYDVLIVTKLISKEVFKILKNTDRISKRAISMKIVKPSDYADMAKHDPALYQRIEIDKIRLV